MTDDERRNSLQHIMALKRLSWEKRTRRMSKDFWDRAEWDNLNTLE